MTFPRRVAVCVAALAAVLLPQPPVTAQTQRQVDDLVLQSQTPWVAKGGTFTVRLKAPPPQTAAPGDLEFAVSVYPVSPSRSVFTKTLTDRPRSSPLAVVTTGVTEAATDAGGSVTLDVGVQDPALPRDRTRVGLRGAGVYPVTVELRTIGGAVHARLRTHLIFVPETPAGPRLAVGIVVPLRTPLALQADGTDRLRTSEVNALTRVASTMATLPSAGALLAPSPETLAALARSPRPVDRNALNAVQAAGRDHLVIGAPFVATQEPEATDEGRQASTNRGLDVISSVMGPPSAGAALITDPNDDRLEADLASRLIVAEGLLQPVSQRVTTAEPVTIRRPNSRIGSLGLIADAGLAAHFDNDEPALLSAHHLLADLATIYFDSPGRFRSVAVVPPASWRPNASFVGPLLAGVESSPILEAAGPDRLFKPATPRTTPRTRNLKPVPTPPAQPSGYTALRHTITSLRSVMADAPDASQSFADRLLITASAAFTATQRRAYVRELSQAVTAERRKFQLPSGGSLTLTARRGGIPITVQRTADYPAHVILELASDRLRFPDGATKEIVLTRRNTTQRFTVQALGSGNVPLRVLLKSPDGAVVLADARLTIRSRNVSGVGIGLSAGALIFLLVWWYRHARYVRRRAAEQ